MLGPTYHAARYKVYRYQNLCDRPPIPLHRFQCSNRNSFHRWFRPKFQRDPCISTSSTRRRLGRHASSLYRRKVATRANGDAHTQRRAYAAPSDVVNVDFVTTAAVVVVLAEIEANATLFFSTVCVSLVDLGALRKFTVSLQ